MGQGQEAARKEIIGSSARLAVLAVDRQYARQPGVWEKYGAAGREQAIADASYHVSFLAEAVGAGEPSLFLDYCDWVAELFRGLHLPDPISSAARRARRVILSSLSWTPGRASRISTCCSFSPASGSSAGSGR